MASPDDLFTCQVMLNQRVIDLVESLVTKELFNEFPLKDLEAQLRAAEREARPTKEKVLEISARGPMAMNDYLTDARDKAAAIRTRLHRLRQRSTPSRSSVLRTLVMEALTARGLL